MMLLCGWRKRRNNKSSTSTKNRTQTTHSSSSDEHETNDNNAQPIVTANTNPIDAAVASDATTIDTVKSNDDNSTESSNKSMFMFHLLQHLRYYFLFTHSVIFVLSSFCLIRSFRGDRTKL